MKKLSAAVLRTTCESPNARVPIFAPIAQSFGYDPLVFIPALGRSVAELDAATKNAHSHRALAAARMLALMREAWRLG